MITLAYGILAWMFLRTLLNHLAGSNGKARYDEAVAANRKATEKILELEKQFLEARETIRQNRELEAYILSDALSRETRAILALVAVLREGGCSEDQISVVIERVKDGSGFEVGGKWNGRSTD